jgi:hypothetical protein
MRLTNNNNIIAININSFVIAASIIINVVYSVLTVGKGINGITSLFLTAVYAIGLANIVFTNKGKLHLRQGKKFLLLEVFLLAACVLTMLFADQATTITIGDFIFYCFLPALFLLFEFDTEKILRYGMYMSLITVLGINTLLVDQAISRRFSQTNLGTIYDLLPCIVLAMFHFFYYRKKSSIFIKICYVYYLYVLIRMLLVIVRGALLTLLIGAVIIYVNRPQSNWDVIRKWSIKKKFIIGCGLILSIIMVLNYEIMITGIYTFLEARGINFGVITKFYFYMSSGNITDNREPYYELVNQMFAQSPIYGNGVQTFYAYSADGAAYPHNYILQFLFEGGLVLMIPLTFITLRELYRVLASKYINTNDFVLSSCLVLLSVIPGMFSMNIWYNRSFWMVIMFGLLGTKSNLRIKGRTYNEDRRFNISQIS